MADEQGTQNGGAATATQQSSTEQGNAAAQANQPVNTGAQQQAGNSGSGDGSNGAAEGGDRQRPNRAERRIGALHGELAEALNRAQTAEEEAQRLRAQLEAPIGDRVKMPDYSNVDQVTPEQLKQDIINTADQIVKIRLEEGLRQNAQVLTQRQSNDRVLADIDTVVAEHDVLNPSNEEVYDPDLEKYLVGSFQRAYKGDPTYRLKDHVDEYFRQNPEKAGHKRQTNTNQAAASSDRSRGAVRSSGQRSASGGKAVADMTAQEFREYVASGGRV